MATHGTSLSNDGVIDSEDDESKKGFAGSGSKRNEGNGEKRVYILNTEACPKCITRTSGTEAVNMCDLLRAFFK